MVLRRFFRFNLLAISVFYLLIASLFYFKASYVDRVFGDLVGCDKCFYLDLFFHEGVFFSIVSIAYLASFCARSLVFVFLLRVIVFFALFFYMSDLLILQNFFVRLSFSHIKLYAGDLGLVWRYMESAGWLGAPLWQWLVGILGFIFVFIWRSREKLISPPIAPLLVVSIFCLVIAAISRPNVYVHDWALRNYLVNSLKVGEQKTYSQSYQEDLFWRLPKPEICEQGRNGKRDLVLMILESWSPYQSRLWQGHKDWTPRLDELAANYTYFTNFHAAGFTTNEGLMSLLSGMEFLSPIKSFFAIAPFEGAWGRESLAALSKSHGYHTAFLTSGNLAFSDKGAWIEHLGFDYWEGHDYPGYNGIGRLHFDSVPDDKLYGRSLGYFKEQKTKSDQPVFLVIESVSTHHPYVHPYTKEKSEEAVFRYMDQTVYDFYQGLVEQNFFINGGRLLIVSDHRAMIPISSEELRTYGRRSASLVPAMLISDDIASSKIEGLFHQADLLYTLKKDLQQQVCSSRPLRDLYDPVSLDYHGCVFHARGDRRDRIDVFCKSGEGTVALAGDATRFVDAQGLSESQQRELLDEINWHRLQSHRLHESWKSR